MSACYIYTYMYMSFNLLQYSSGADLAMLLIEVLNTSKTNVSEENTGGCYCWLVS